MKIKGIEYKLPEEFKEKWVAALRSGKYKQSRGVMYLPVEDGYCCLGVAARVCDISKKDIERLACIYPSSYYIKNFNKYPKELIGYFDQPLIRKLAHFNDIKKKSFKWIAAYIERYL